MSFLCVDVGSTFTKAAWVSTDGELLGTATHRTTIDSDVLDGVDACVEALGSPEAEVLACSSAGGGLRIAVVGNEELVTAEAGRRVALSSGGRVVSVTAGRPTASGLGAPDVVLLVGGTDGGNSDVLLDCAAGLATWTGPTVVAGNVDVRDEVAALLAGPVVLADNVMPRIGTLAPESAREAIRSVFLEHVIGGKSLSAGDRFASLVRGATPDVVLTGVEVLAALVGDVVVVDIGGATTDVHSVVEPDPDSIGREVVATTRITRTVEGDLGMRWSAVTTAEAGVAEGWLPHSVAPLALARQQHPDYLPADGASVEVDHSLAAVAAGVALRRHAGRSQVVYSPEGRVVQRSGKDLRPVSLVIGSGGVLRHAGPGAADVVRRHLDAAGGWQLPEDPRVVIDVDYVLAAVGLLAARSPEAARRLATRLL